MLTFNKVLRVVSFSYECWVIVADFSALRVHFAQMSLKLDVSLSFFVRLVV